MHIVTIVIFVLNIVLFYTISHFKLPPFIPYLLVGGFFISYYMVFLHLLRAKEQTIQDQLDTLKNNHGMIRGQMHDISNFVGTAYGWCQSTFKTSDLEKKREHWQKATYSFNKVSEQLRTISTLLSDTDTMVQLSSMAPSTFINELRSFVSQSFAFETKLDDSTAPVFLPQRISFAIPRHFTGKRLAIDLRAFKDVLRHLVSNAEKADATSMIILFNENIEKQELNIIVKDNGTGIPQSMRGVLFREKINSAGGSGTGLLHVRMIIESHGAKIRLGLPPADLQAKQCTEFVISGLKLV